MGQVCGHILFIYPSGIKESVSRNQHDELDNSHSKLLRVSIRLGLYGVHIDQPTQGDPFYLDHVVAVATYSCGPTVTESGTIITTERCQRGLNTLRASGVPSACEELVHKRPLFLGELRHRMD